MAGEVIGPVLQARGLNAHQGREHVLRGVELSIHQGGGIVLTGPSGAGKSTLLRALAGLVVPSGGDILFKGQQIEGRPANEIAKLGIGFVPKERRVFARMTAYENLEIGRRLGSKPSRSEWSFERVFHLFPVLAAQKDRFAGDMSPGEQRLLILARTLLGNPEVVLLDEPAEGIAEEDLLELVRILDRIRGEGVALLLAERQLRVGRTVCDRACLLENGKITQQDVIVDADESESEDMGRSRKVAAATS